MKWIFTCSLAAVLLLLITPSASAVGLDCEIIPEMMERYLEDHVSGHPDDADINKRLVDLYSKRLDSSQSLLNAADFQKVRLKVAKVVKEVRKGNCKDLLALHEETLKWHKEMELFTAKMLSNPSFKIDTTIELQADADKRERPKDDAARNELRRKLIHFQMAGYTRSGSELKEAKKKLVHRYELTTKRYAEMDKGDLYNGFLNTFSNTLDPHSTYFSSDDLADFRISMSLSLEGIGAVLSSRDGYTTVQEVVLGGAADRHGELKTKDKIIAVAQGEKGESVDVVDMSLRDVVRLIRGKKDSVVKLTILRQGKRTETLNLLITRDKIDLKEQAAKLTWEEREVDGKAFKLAVLDLPSFYGSRGPDARYCADDVKKLLKEANEGGADGLLLDLSRNGGGLLSASVDISGFFISQGPIVSIDGPSTPNEVLKDKDPRIQFSAPVVVLTSRVSASASEILAGALKDYKRAIIVGDDHTYGKGSVQNIISLPSELGALKLTTSMFFRPGGASTQNLGVESDILVQSYLNSDDIGEKNQDYALPPKKTAPFLSKKANLSDPKKAWKPISAKTIKSLAKKSAKRVAESKDFKEIQETLDKQLKNKGIIKLAELLEDPKKEDDEEKEKKDKKELSPQAQEALTILADLVAETR